MDAITGSPLGEIQQAMYSVIRADAPLNTLLGGRVYDAVPQGEVFPYLVFAEFSHLPWNTHTTPGGDIIVGLDIWSTYDGYRELQQAEDHLLRLFGQSHLSVPGYDTVFCVHDGSQYDLMPDGVRRLGFDVRLLVQQASASA